MPAENRTPTGQFPKGVSGNPNGRPKNAQHKTTLEIKDAARRILLADDPQIYIDNVRHRILCGEAPHMENFFAAHLWGKPKETIDVQGSIEVVLTMFGSGRGLETVDVTPERRALPSHESPSDDEVEISSYGQADYQSDQERD